MGTKSRSVLRALLFLFSLGIWTLFAADTASAGALDLLDALEERLGSRLTLGEPVDAGGVRVVPVVEISVRESRGDAGVVGAAGSVAPVGLLLFSSDGVQFVPVRGGGTFFSGLAAGLVRLFREYRAVVSGEALPDDARELSLPETVAFILRNAPPQLVGLVMLVSTLHKALFLAGWAILALLLKLLLPGLPLRLSGTLADSPWRSFAAGTGLCIAGAISATLLALSLAGIPAGFALVQIWTVAAFVGLCGVAEHIGRTLLRRRAPDAVVPFALGVVLLVLLRFLPVLGWGAWILLSSAGIGSAALSSRRGRPSYNR